VDDAEHALLPRFFAQLVSTALRDTPVVVAYGPRQCGKTTLVRYLVAGNREFTPLDDDTVLAAARDDPTGLVRALDRTSVDEVQRVPDLLRDTKMSVDAGARNWCQSCAIAAISNLNLLFTLALVSLRLKGFSRG
jgi:predicted AAA+ superfamily ATPase